MLLGYQSWGLSWSFGWYLSFEHPPAHIYRGLDQQQTHGHSRTMDILLSYKYTKLQRRDEVRLLTLLPGSGWADLHCRLEHVQLLDFPAFEAVSYAWGDASLTHFVLCEGARLTITKSLHVALRHLRHPYEERRLWADGVCINQKDDMFEKNHQLPLMPEIYSKATTVLVWIGEDEDHKAQKAFEQISGINTHLPPGRHNPTKLRRYLRDRVGNHGIEEHVVQILKGISPVFAKSWFKRLWVVQEVCSAQNAIMVFGTAEITMDCILNVIGLLNKLEEVNNNQQHIDIAALRNLVNIGRIQRGIDTLPAIENQAPCPAVLELLRWTQGYEFSNPRDRIYALLGMTNEMTFRSDYKLNVVETYMTFANWVLRSTSALYLLSYARGTSDSDSNIPSWCSSPNMGELPMTLLHVEHFDASRVTDNRELTSHRPISVAGELRLDGRILDHVERRGETWTNATAVEKKRRCLKVCADIAGHGLGEKPGDRFSRAMTLDISKDWKRAPPQQCEIFQRFYEGLVNRLYQEPVHEKEEARQMSKLLSTWARCRYFCGTRKHRFAWVPMQAQCGDEICIFRNARLPYVVRLQENGTHVLVGECWIEGLMEGEALDSSRPRWKEIILV